MNGIYRSSAKLRPYKLFCSACAYFIEECEENIQINTRSNVLKYTVMEYIEYTCIS